MPVQYAEQYNNMYKYWSFIQKTLIQSRLAEKYQLNDKQICFEVEISPDEHYE
jgi:hypothetical protein